MNLSVDTITWDYLQFGEWLDLLHRFSLSIREQCPGEVLALLAATREDMLVQETNVAIILRNNTFEIRQKILTIKLEVEKQINDQMTISLAFISENDSQDIEFFRKALKTREVTSEPIWKQASRELTGWIKEKWLTKIHSIYWSKKENDLVNGANFIIVYPVIPQQERFKTFERALMIAGTLNDQISFAIHYMNPEEIPALKPHGEQLNSWINPHFGE